MRVFSSTELRQVLDVNRSWVQDHLRCIGNKSGDRQTDVIYYDEGTVLKQINEQAAFSRKSVRIDLCQYMSLHEASAYLRAFERLPTKSPDFRKLRDQLYREILSRIIALEPDATYLYVPIREMTKIPWVPVTHHINSLDELRTIKKLKNELQIATSGAAYTHIFSYGMIRMEFKGRTWFVNDIGPEPKCPMTLPAGLLT